MVSRTNVFVLDENAVVPDSWRAPMLSSYICTEENWGFVNLLNKSDSRTASWFAYASAIYSDSHDESATGPPANMRK